MGRCSLWGACGGVFRVRCNRSVLKPHTRDPAPITLVSFIRRKRRGTYRKPENNFDHRSLVSGLWCVVTGGASLSTRGLAPERRGMRDGPPRGEKRTMLNVVRARQHTRHRRRHGQGTVCEPPVAARRAPLCEAISSNRKQHASMISGSKDGLNTPVSVSSV